MRTLGKISGAWTLGIIFLLVAIQDAVAASARTILVVGDSLSAGYGLRPDQSWVALLQKRLQTEGYEYRVVNASVSGETTSGGLQRLPRALELHAPEIVILELGANDGLRGLPLTATREQLARMVELSRMSGARVLLLGMRLPPNYGPRYSEEFAGIFKALGKHKHVALVPFFFEKIATDERYFLADGLHPAAEAQPLLLQTVWPGLEPLLQQK